MITYSLGRLAPSDDDHIRKYPLRALGIETPTQVDKSLGLPYWHWTHDQGAEGSCVGHGVAMERAISNTAQNYILRIIGAKVRRYDPIDIWNQAKIIDEWPDTNPGDENGTSVRAGYDVARDKGVCRVKTMRMEGNVPVPVGASPRDPNEGIAANRWATTVDEVRASIAGGSPVTIGVNWYSNFDNPVQKGRDYWVGQNSSLGKVRGGHCLAIYGASDRRQAVKLKNSWGRAYPLVWMPYTVLQRLLNEDGEAAIVTDR